MKNIIRLLRPQQWIKNLFILVPLFFGGALFDLHALCQGLVAVLAFSLAASSVYCYNDIVDADADRQHPVKCRRPVASGAISTRQAYGLMALMLVLSAGVTLLIDARNMLYVQTVIAFYYVLNMAYCSRLKQYAIIDVCTVAFGFVLRLLAGGLATDIQLSKWIVLMTFLITLFMSFAKRRDDVVRMNATGQAPRKNTSRYNLTFINQAITITASVTLVCYIMYTVSPEVTEHFSSPYLYLTSIFVLLGLLRYIQIAVVDQKSGDPTKIILHDHFTQLIVVLWGLSFLFLIYL